MDFVKNGSGLTHIVAALNENPKTLAARMHLGCDAVIVNQCHEDRMDSFQYEDHLIRVICSSARGVGRSRNQGLLLAESEYALIGDEDIVYREGYAESVLREFRDHPEADVILFNVTQSAGRETYHNADHGRVHLWNCGRYPAYSIALRTEKQQEVNVWFSLLFGGGARYAAGEDSLFLADCLKKGLKLYRSPVCLGEETARDSTWFTGYNDRFFRDRGTLYRALYGRMAVPLTLYFLYRKRREWLADRTFGSAYRLMREGMR